MTPERIDRLRSVLDRRQPDLTVVTDFVHKQRNLSAIVRVCDAAGVSTVHPVLGSGQFLENIARYLGVPIDDVGRLSLTSKEPEKCSGVCAVLAETDVINMVSRGITTADILKGIHLSIATRLVRLLRAANREGGAALVTGGLAQDVGLLGAMREIVSEEAPGEFLAG